MLESLMALAQRDLGQTLVGKTSIHYSPHSCQNIRVCYLMPETILRSIRLGRAWVIYKTRDALAQNLHFPTYVFVGRHKGLPVLQS